MKTIFVTPDDDLQKILDGISEPTTISLAAGIYRQKIKIRTDKTVLEGAGRETTVITWSDYARKPHPDGREYNTFRTYTVCVTGKDVKLKNLCVQNGNTDPASVGQCVALSVNADEFYAENVDLKSTQDTLFTSPFPDDLVTRYSDAEGKGEYYDGFIPRDELYCEGGNAQLYRNCRIYGTVDFIFGCAEAHFYECEIISLEDGRGIGYVAAPAHPLREKRGYTFMNCTFKSGGAGKNTVFLARPWRDYGRCNFINCTLGSHVRPELFDKWNDTYRDKTARFFYYGLNCEGFTPKPVSWSHELTEKEADKIENRTDELLVVERLLEIIDSKTDKTEQ